MKYLIILLLLAASASILFIPNIRNRIPFIPEFGTELLPYSTDLQSYFKEAMGIFTSSSSKNLSPKAKTILKVGVLSDSHGSTENLESAIRDMTVTGVEHIFHLGDFSAGGELEYFQEAKIALDNSGKPYSVIPGDHDFNWVPSYSRSNYESVFGAEYQKSIEIKGVTFILFDNSNTSVELPDRKVWLSQALASRSGTTILFTSEPLYSEYFAYKADERGPEVISMLESAGVSYAVAGNTHVYSEYSNPQETITFVTVGAIGEYKNPLAQWVLVEVKDDGTVDFKPQPLVEF